MSTEIKPGLKFRSKNFEMDAEIFAVHSDENKVEVLLKAKDGHEWLEKDWNLQHTKCGFESAEYFVSPTNTEGIEEQFTKGECQLSKKGQVIFIGAVSICNTYGHLKSEWENKANAARIVKTWNCHDELVESILELTALLEQYIRFAAASNNDPKEERDRLVNEDSRVMKYRKLLSKVNSK